MNDEKITEAQELIDFLEDAIKDLEHFSAYNDDVFDVQLLNSQKLVEDYRKQLAH